MENPKFDINYMTQSGLLAVTLDDDRLELKGIELTIEDINEINEAVEKIGKDRIASREDFN